MLIDNMIDLWI